jgi:hypothetical protein
MENIFDTYLNIDFKKSLLDYFPKGMFADDIEIESNAKNAIDIIEELIKENVNQIVDFNRYSNLQLFKRNIKNTGLLSGHNDAYSIDNFNYLIGKVLLPDRFQAFFEELSEEQSEAFLKIYFSNHEFSGQYTGIEYLVKIMMEASLDESVKVKVDNLMGDNRDIPQNMISHLKTSNSMIGSNFIIGSKVKCRSRNYHIYIGPIDMNQLNVLNEDGWCDGEMASEKLYKLVSFSEPYYINSRIHILLSRVGFKLGYSKIGNEKLGSNIS